MQDDLKAALRAARELIDNGKPKDAIAALGRLDVSVPEVAYLLGFGTATGFSRAFTRWTGEAPRSYRAKLTRTPLSRP